MNDKDMALQIIEKAGALGKSLAKGKDIEIRKDTNGLKILEVEKKVVR